MTNEEAVRILRRIQEPEAWEPQINGAAFEALDMAIEALGQKQPAGSKDLISRSSLLAKYDEQHEQYRGSDEQRESYAGEGRQYFAYAGQVHRVNCQKYDGDHVDHREQPQQHEPGAL